VTHSCESTVFLIDDDAAVRQAMAEVTRSLELPLEILVSAAEYLDQFDPLRPGCLVVDVHLSGMSGLELLEKFHRDRVCVASVAVAADPDISTAVRAMRAGAVTFLKKPVAEQPLWDAIGEALARDAEFRRRQAQIERIHRRMEKLTEGETDVLKLLLAGNMNREIAETLDVSVRTVEVRRAKLMEKMKADTLPEMLRDVFFLEFSAEKKLW
jgi:two-component system, LuxR family, response regulator FixJ